MFIEKSIVREVREIQKGIFLLKAFSPKIVKDAEPGQFLNIKVTESNYPLLRRPFSICDVEDECYLILFNIHGEGTKYLSNKKVGDELDTIGPLGNGFNYKDKFETAIIVAGGLGAAPFPFLIKKLFDKKIYSFIGGKTERDVIKYNIPNISEATDDGSNGFNGTVVSLFSNEIKNFSIEKVKVFACGPNAMLKSLQKLCKEKNIKCEISTECAMACGFGICQGCPIESASDSSKYKLVCKDGPVFNSEDVIL